VLKLAQNISFLCGAALITSTLGVEIINGMQPLKKTCCSAFEGIQTNPSATQQQVSETLRHSYCRDGCLFLKTRGSRLSVEDEARSPKSGYSIAMLVHVHDSALRQEAGGCGQWR
jgi:hypothetical protein